MKRVALFLAFLTSACVGQIGFGAGGSEDGVDDTPGDDDPVVPDEPRHVCKADDRDKAGPRLLRRLTNAELAASVRDVLGLSAAEWAGPVLPPDASAKNGFTNAADRLAVDEGYAKQLMGTAKQIAEATTRPTALARVLPCAAQGGAACAETYLATVGRRFYRRALTDEERQRFLDLHTKVTASADFTTWVYWATVGLVTSPNFVYRSELGEASGDGYQLTGWEVATALAYDLTGKPPSEALLAQAEAGALDSAEGRLAAARALALDGSGNLRPELRARLMEFNGQWLGLSALQTADKSQALYPTYTAEVKDAMRRETEAFLAHVLLDEKGTVADLLTSPVTFLDQTLTAFYGYGFAGPSLTQVDRPAEYGVGLLAQGSILAIYANNEWSSPTRRGKLVRNRLLCQEVPAPPPVVGDLEPPSPELSTRERYEAHVQKDTCKGCHVNMDPIGFTMEHFDAAGRYRTDDGGKPIDATGYLLGVGPSTIDLDGQSDLATTLAGRPETGECMAAFMASYAFGLDHHDTPCLVSTLAERFGRGELSMVDYWIELAATNHFVRRVD